MICSCCEKEIPIDSTFCCYCGKKQKIHDQSIKNDNKIDGDNNITNNIGRDNYGQIVINSPQIAENNCFVERSYIKKLSIAGTTVKTKWMSIVGGIGFLADLTTILVNSFTIRSNGHYFFFLFLILFLGILVSTFIIGIILYRYRFLPLPKGYSLESDKNGAVFITKITGKCNIHKCDGNLSLRLIKINENLSKTIIQCNRNLEHKWKFDYTIFDDSDLK